MVAIFPSDGAPPTKSDYAYTHIRKAILSGALAPQSILNQAELATTLGVSTTPLRESLRRLASEGLVELKSYRDAFVVPLTVEEARGIVELRAVLDPMAVELAAERRTHTDIQLIMETHERLSEKSAGAHDSYAVLDIELHREFHAAIYRACQNPLLSSTLDLLWDKSERYRTLGQSIVSIDEQNREEKRNRKLAEHNELVECILRSDPARAGDVMRRHTNNSLVSRAAEALANADADADADAENS